MPSEDTGNWYVDDSTSLDSFYNTQFVQNETLIDNGGGTFEIIHYPVLPGSMCGTVYLNNAALYTFVVKSDGTTNFQGIGTPSHQVSELTLDGNNGLIFLKWKDDLTNAQTRLVVSYEYTLQPKKKIPDNLPGIRVGATGFGGQEALIRTILSHLANEESSVAKCFVDIVRDCPVVEKLATEVWQDKFKTRELPWKR